MFIFELSSWVDRYDPYWYSRLMALKLSYIAVVLFMANLFLHPPLANLVMLIAGVGMLFLEMPSINDLNKKDNIYLGYIILMCLTIGLFSSYIYLKGWFIVVVAGWCYSLYTALKRAPQLFPLVSIVLMLGIMSLEGFNTGNFYVILNELLFILEFALIVFWAHKLFPNLYHLIWLSCVLRTLEGLQKMLAAISVAEQQTVLRHTLCAERSLRLLIGTVYLRQALRMNNCLSYYYYYIYDLILNKTTSSSELSIMGKDLQQLAAAIRRRQALVLAQPGDIATRDSALAAHFHLFAKLNQAWNKICVPASN